MRSLRTATLDLMQAVAYVLFQLATYRLCLSAFFFSLFYATVFCWGSFGPDFFFAPAP